MSCILYYSNFCEHSKKILQILAKSQVAKDVHFVCIDNRTRERDGKVYIQLKNNQKMVMPDNITRVPAMLLLNKGYQVLYGEAILDHFRPQEVTRTQVATQNNMEPMAFSFGAFSGYGGGIASDNFSFVDLDADSLGTKGGGGLSQMHSYVSVNDNGMFTKGAEESSFAGKLKEGDIKMEDLQKKRDSELANINYRKV